MAVVIVNIIQNSSYQSDSIFSFNKIVSRKDKSEPEIFDKYYLYT